MCSGVVFVLLRLSGGRHFSFVIGAGWAGKILAGFGGVVLSSFELWLTKSDLDMNSILPMARTCLSNA